MFSEKYDCVEISIEYIKEYTDEELVDAKMYVVKPKKTYTQSEE